MKLVPQLINNYFFIILLQVFKLLCLSKIGQINLFFLLKPKYYRLKISKVGITEFNTFNKNYSLDNNSICYKKLFFYKFSINL